jgi:hypothetical protein
VTPRWRLPVLVTGLIVLGYGTLLLLSGGSAAPTTAVGVWLAGSLVGHDLLLAPLTLVVGALAFRRLHGRERRAVAAGLLVAACLVLVALPALLTPGVPGNPTATPRNYGAGLTVLLAADAAVTAALVLTRRRRRSDRLEGPAARDQP